MSTLSENVEEKSVLSFNETSSQFGNALSAIPEAPLDPILGTKVMFLADKDNRKINLGIGAYRTDAGQPYVLNCVRKAEAALAADKTLNHEYLTQDGFEPFQKIAAAMLFGEDSKAVKENRVATFQTLSGTGSLRIGGEFVKQFFPNASIYVSTPTWGNHITVFERSHVKVAKYRYWDAKSRSLDIKGMLDDIRAAPPGSFILLHGCAHNPTGVDPTMEQWKQVAEVVKARDLIAFFDIAYQGFATGDLDRDAASLRYFTDYGCNVMCCQSFAKNLGLYSERVGSFNVVCPTTKAAVAIKSQINIIIRAMYSNPPAHGARIVHYVVSRPELYAEWKDEMKLMSGRIMECRQKLRSELERLGTPGDWSHVTSQIGMFSYTGLSPEQCEVLIKKHHIYLLKNGRISMAGVNSKNVSYLAQSIDDVVRNVK